MSTDTSSKQLDVYDIVTNRILELFEQEIIPWQKPWTDKGIPRNLISKRPYRGINLWLLHSLNYEQNLFLTWQQLKKLGASVKRGENGHVVAYSKPIKGATDTEHGKTKPPSRLLYYKVFNISQCTGVPKDIIPVVEQRDEDPVHQCEVLVEKMLQLPTIKHRGQKPMYDDKKDCITMPSKKSFDSDETYYATLFHQLIHSTASENRLHRSYESERADASFDPYLMEEVVAEIGAAQLCSLMGIPILPPANAEIYVVGFSELLKSSNKYVVQAAGYAQMAVDYILNNSPATEETKEEAEHSASQKE
jgi:antirestriction protein ArdC